ncbi:acetamidase/formamidase family protein [Methylobacterium iners]
MRKSSSVAVVASVGISLAMVSGVEAQGSPPALSTPQTQQDAGDTKKQEQLPGAAKDATQGQTLRPTQPTVATQPDLQNSKTFLPFVYGPLGQPGMKAEGSGGQPTTYLLSATPATTQWGWFDNAEPPVLRIRSGDTVVMETMMHSHNQLVPGITIEQVKKTRTDYPGRGPHSLTGPIYVEEAEPGDVLRVRINKVVPRAYGMNFNIPGMFGQFPKEFPEGQIKFFYLDLEKMQTEFAPGIVIPLKPFPGTLGVARAEPGRYSSVPPGRFAGNLDIREMGEGATLYVPVFVKGALLWSGDSHAVQGNGEVNLTALETAYKELNLTIDVLKGQQLEWPRIETQTDWITIGYDEDLNRALDLLKAETTKFLIEQRNVPREQAQQAMLDGWNCPISEVVNIVKGTYCMIPKAANAARPAPLPTQETAEAFVTVDRNAHLGKAMDGASMAMINALVEKKGLSRLDAYGLVSMTMDCRIAPHSEGDKVVHCMVPKSLWTK